MNVQDGEAPAPRRLVPSLDADLETVVLTCLEKDPDRRYPTADALAEDLTRWLEGEPVRARRPGPVHRLRKAIARRRGIALAAAVGLLAAGAAVGTILPALGREEERLVRRMRATADLGLQAALLRRQAGDLPGMKRAAEELRELCAEVARRHPGLAEPHYLLGRMHRMLMRFDRALEEQELALARDPAMAAARYERGLLRIRAYEERLEALREQWWRRVALDGSGPAAARRPSRAELEDDDARRLRAEARADLERVDEPVARGLVAWLDGDAGTAAERFAAATRSTPDVEEAWEWSARTSRDQRRYDEAIRWHTEGLGRDRGYLPHLQGRARAHFDKAFHAAPGGEDASASYAAAVADLDELLRHRPEDDEGWMLRGLARVNWGVRVRRQGGDPSELYRAALADLDEAVRLRPSRHESWTYRGSVRANWAFAVDGRGGDPTELYRAAVADLDEAVRRHPAAAEGWESRGWARVSWAGYRWRRVARANWGAYVRGRGGDPSDLLRAAIADFDEALRLNPSSDASWRYRGVARTTWARHLRARGGDPSELYRAAVADLDEAVRLNPAGAESWMRRGTARANWAAYRKDRGEDPSDPYREAIAD